jgi:leucyl aminopeptidase
MVLTPSCNVADTYTEEHVIDKAILAALEMYSDPVATLVFLQPELVVDLAAPQLLYIAGKQKPQWMTKGDKLHLRRCRKKFMDITDHQSFYAQHTEALWASKASKSASSTHSRCALLMLLQTCPI